ncbi:MAG: hypothetical protein ACJ72V_10855 [Nitrososphaeraceae archaeon]
MTAITKLVVFTMIVASLTFAIAAATSITANTFLNQSAYAQSIQTTPPSTSAPTNTFPSGNTTLENSTSGNAIK